MRRAISWALRLGLGGLFVVTGVLKLRDPAAFATAIANYQLLPQFAALLAATLPAVEVVTGLALIAAPAMWRRAAAVAIVLMMVVFTIAAFTALARGIDISCGCFGAESGRVDALTIVRDLVLLAAAVAVVADGRPGLATPPAPSSDR
jgi:putative oxidoreductase